MNHTTNKKAAKQAYRDGPSPAGVYQILNNQTGQRLLASAPNARGALNRHRFELKFRQHRNKTLQRDWLQHGEESFTLCVLAQVKPDEQNVKDALEELLSHWKTTLNHQDEESYSSC